MSTDTQPEQKGSNLKLVLIVVAIVVAALLGLACLIAIIAAIAIPSMVTPKFVANHASTVAALRMTAAAQAQYQAKYDQYALSAAELGEEQYVDPAFVGAFESHYGSRDFFVAAKNGYRFRMFQGMQTDPKSFQEAKASGIKIRQVRWGATARPDDPGISGRKQYYVSEEGIVRFKTDESQSGTWFLNGVPDTPPQGWFEGGR